MVGGARGLVEVGERGERIIAVVTLRTLAEYPVGSAMMPTGLVDHRRWVPVHRWRHLGLLRRERTARGKGCTSRFTTDPTY